MLISHLVLPLAPRLSPEAPTMCGMLVLSRFFNFSFSYISSDIMLSIAPVSKSVLILVFKLLFVNIWNTVPVVVVGVVLLWESCLLLADAVCTFYLVNVVCCYQCAKDNVRVFIEELLYLFYTA